MKTSNVIAFTALVAFATAAPLEKRVTVVEQVIETVIETVAATTTVWVKPSAAAAAVVPQKQNNPAPVVPSTNKPFAPPPASIVQAPADSPVAVSTPSPTPSPPPAPAPAPIQAEVKPQAPTPQAPAPTPSPVSTPPAPPPSAPPSSAPSPVSSAPVAAIPSSGSPSGGSCGTVGGQCSGDITYYDTTGVGACGWTNDGTQEDVFALAHVMMGSQSNGNPFCGRMATITYNGVTATAKLVDKCMGCDGESIDLSHHLFDQFAPELAGRLHNVTWSFTS